MPLKRLLRHLDQVLKLARPRQESLGVRSVQRLLLRADVDLLTMKVAACFGVRQVRVDPGFLQLVGASHQVPAPGTPCRRQVLPQQCRQRNHSSDPAERLRQDRQVHAVG